MADIPRDTPPPAPPAGIEVLKLGGSLLGAEGAHPRLAELLAALAARGAPLVVVAGGGTLADAVRALQPRLGLSEACCHQMAILAMEQTALALADLGPGLLPCADETGITAAHAAGRAALWLPSHLAGAAEVPASWEVTSDSLALWLAIRLGAARLTLVKAARVEWPLGPPERWAADGLVDTYLPILARRFGGEVRALSVADALADLGTGAPQGQDDDGH
ncbi:aspartate kinase [Ancylobacter sp. 6x-1]|uniref:Aspartate kinase n=1 Tax=Ancylobacter crimeensis TaxID=2579147 RepID=A0ABT0D8L8_9HYPH|nr:aspartate kinase [Ancylobacter crimeensis]MCK0196287.1 aspartate kinase [Ancylobacter crimeensis]